MSLLTESSVAGAVKLKRFRGFASRQAAGFAPHALWPGALCGFVWVGLLSLALPACPDASDCAGWHVQAGNLLVDRNSPFFIYPFTIQNVMWVIFFTAAGCLLGRQRGVRVQQAQLDLHLLPEDTETVLTRGGEEIGTVYQRSAWLLGQSGQGGPVLWLPNLLAIVIRQFQGSGSTEQASTVLTSSLELYQHESDVGYGLLRYFVWVIPTLGFVGTVTGIALALSEAGEMFSALALSEDDAVTAAMMRSVTEALGVAFYTTLVALLQSVVLMLGVYRVQSSEETVLNRTGRYCLENLINRLDGGVPQESADAA